MTEMKYASVCSGIEAPTVAWHRLGWEPAWFSEIEKFPSKVLAHHYPHVPNLGDMTKLNGNPIYEQSTIDLLVGGTPCQSFSIAGLRKGMADPRGNLALAFLSICDTKRPRWVVWENVPGVLSSNGGKDFGAFIGGLAELGYSCAYRVLDAQYFGVPQRRRRVFVVGYLGNDWRPPFAVLFERESMSGNPAPGREEGTQIAATLTRGAESSGKGGYAGRRREDDVNIVSALTANGVGTCGADDNQAQANHLIVMAHGQGGAEVVSDGSPSLTCNHEAPIFFDVRNSKELLNQAHTLQANTGKSLNSSPLIINARQDPITSDIAQPLDTDGHSQAICCAPDIAETLSVGANQTTGFNGEVVFTGAIRRLTPMECERLQGFPDNYTSISGAADGPRYKAIGNSMAVDVMEWIGRRIDQVEKILKAQ